MGTLHHVIIRGIEQRQIVDGDKDRRDFVHRLGKPVPETKTAIYAWALVTNHAHILLRSSPFGVSIFRCHSLLQVGQFHYAITRYRF